MTNNKTKTAPPIAVLLTVATRPYALTGFQEDIPLLSIGGRTIIDRHVRTMLDLGIKHVVVVTDDQPHTIREHVSLAFPDDGLHFASDPQAAVKTDDKTAVSLAEETNGPRILTVEANTIYFPHVLKRALEHRGGDTLVVSRAPSHVRDQPRVLVDRFGSVTEFCPDLNPDDSSLIYAGIELLSNSTASILFEEFSGADDQYDSYGNAWRSAHQALLRKGTPFRVVVVQPLECIRIVSLASYTRAKEVFG